MGLSVESQFALRSSRWFLCWSQTAVVELDEADAGFGEASGEEALAAEVGEFAGAADLLFPDLIALEGGFGFGGDIEEIGRGTLHAESEFHGFDDGLEAGVVRSGGGVLAVHGLDEVELLSLCRWEKVVAADIVDGGVRHVLAVDADGCPLVDRREELRWSRWTAWRC